MYLLGAFMNKPLNILLFGLTIILSNCNSYKYISIPQSDKITIPVKVNTAVPHIPQMDSYSCATTSAAMAVSYFINKIEDPLDKDYVWKISKSDIYTINHYGNNMIGLKNITDYFGLRGEFHNKMTLLELKYILSIGALVVVNIRPNLSESSTHAVLVTGYDDNLGQLDFMDTSVRSPKYTQSYEEYLLHWNGWLSNPIIYSERCGFIIYPNK
jgi:hypothetical protein